MYTIQSLIEKLRLDTQYEFTCLFGFRCPEKAVNILRSMNVEVYSGVAFLVTKEDRVRLINILETLE